VRLITWDASFRRAFRRRTRNNAYLEQRILHVIELLAQDSFNPLLKTHKLHGKLEGLWACWVEYDCRIVFTFEPAESGEDRIVLIDIGTHDEVY